MARRLYLPYWELEEHEHGMWRSVPPSESESYIEAAAHLMRRPDAFEEAMARALTEWPRSVSAAMTTESLNRRAWFGHAGCCIATGSPEHLTRLGWHRLTVEEQDAANAAADRVIERWARSRTGDDLQMELFGA